MYFNCGGESNVAMTNCVDGILEILSILKEEDLFALARTITQGLLNTKSRDDAIKGILKHSPNELSILRRRALTREILFSYLDAKNISVKLPATKNDLIDRILELWNITYTKSNFQQEGSEVVCRDDTEIKGEAKEEDNVNLLAEHFSKWFYSLVNDEDIGAEHFYSDAKLKLNLISGNDCDTTSVENQPEEIVHALLGIKRHHNLYFNPNTSKDGVQGRMDPHGLVIVLVCGTLHIENVCAGVFEQVFALARDPFCDNNWKIKHSELNIKSKSDVITPPSLCDGELTSDLLMLPSN